jgi:hypothetical protein
MKTIKNLSSICCINIACRSLCFISESAELHYGRTPKPVKVRVLDAGAVNVQQPVSKVWCSPVITKVLSAYCYKNHRLKIVCHGLY